MEKTDGQGAKRPAMHLLTKDFCLLFGASFASCLIYYLTITVTASYALHCFMCSQSMAGLATSAFMAGAVVGRAVSGQASGPRCRPVTLAGMAVMLAACCAYFLTPAAYELLLAVRIIHGFAFGITGTLLQVLAMESMPPERLGEGVGYFTLSVTLASAIGPFMGYFAAAEVDYQLMFIMSSVAAAAGLACVLAAVALGRGTRAGSDKDAGVETPRKPAAPAAKPCLASLIDLSTLKYSVIVLITGMCYAPLNAFLYSWADELDLSICAPLAFLTYAIVLVFSRPIAGMVLDRKGYVPVMAFSLSAMAIGLAITAAACNAVLFVSIGVFMALGFGTTMSTLQATVTRMTDKPDPTLAVSTMFLLADTGAALGPFLMGFAATAWGYRGMYALCCVVALLCLAYFALLVRAQRR